MNVIKHDGQIYSADLRPIFDELDKEYEVIEVLEEFGANNVYYARIQNLEIVSVKDWVCDSDTVFNEPKKTQHGPDSYMVEVLAPNMVEAVSKVEKVIADIKRNRPN